VARPLARGLGRHLVRDDQPSQADAIVVLGGDVHKRAPHAAALYRAGLAPVVVAVGGTVDQGSLAEARKTARVLDEQGVPATAVLVVSADAPSTRDEARAAVSVAIDHGWHHLAVVTSPYHTWRAGQIFDELAPADLQVAMVPSPLDPYDPAAWWQDARQRRLVRNEYGKYLLWRLTGATD